MGKEKSKNPEKVLIVDDIEVNVEILENIIRAEGYEPLCALNVKEALEIMNHTMPQLILSDYSMPDMNGIEFCKLLKKNPRTRQIRFILITVANSVDVKKEAFEAGVADYILKPYERVEVIMRVNNQMNIYRVRQEIDEHNRRMHRVIEDQKAIMEKEQEHLLVALSKIAEKRSRNTKSHLDRVGYNCRILAQSLYLTEHFEKEVNDEFADIIFTASKLHNVGNLLIPDEMVKKSRLAGEDAGEYTEKHTKEGAELLKEIAAQGSKSRFLDMAADIARYHHAHFDGSGTPKGASGEEIPISARITAVVNDFDKKMRDYGKDEDAVSAVLEEMQALGGNIYDPGILKVFAKITKQLKLP